MEIKQPYISREIDRYAYEALKNIRRRNRFEYENHLLNERKKIFAKSFAQDHQGIHHLHVTRAIKTGFAVLDKSGVIDAAIKAAEDHLDKLIHARADEGEIGYESATPHLTKP